MPYYADLTTAIPPDLISEFLSKLHYVSESLAAFDMASDRGDRVRFRLHPGNDEKAEKIAARIDEVAGKMTRTYRAREAKVLVSRRDGGGRFVLDPHPGLLDRGELREYGSGRYGFGPALVAVMEVFDGKLRRMARGFDALPYQFPSLIGADALDRCQYLRSFPHSLTLAAHLREDLESIQDFATNVHCSGSDLVFEWDTLGSIQCLLAPSICFHWYAWLRDSGDVEPMSITAVGKCFRYESGNLKTLERLWDFSMREIIFVGPKEYVLAQRQKAIDDTVALFDEWGLSYEIRSATDPFFIDEYSSQANFQSAFDLKFEACVDLPYRGDTLAAGSFNYHQDFFGRSFNIRAANGEAVHTSCVGFGLERLVLAFLAQYGPDSRCWPESIRTELTV